ncbi:unnamed protein product [Protopolystoma xenopodis]|uniref:Uncharacterized protein n=1 Tax=Protopolystoma xenopodis TaxID=117903 RepID=A0A448WPF7_9PLAT|nr:unnamed protein product [Protopolystoma xenopodis]
MDITLIQSSFFADLAVAWFSPSLFRQYAKFSLILPSSSLQFIRFLSASILMASVLVFSLIFTICSQPFGRFSVDVVPRCAMCSAISDLSLNVKYVVLNVRLMSYDNECFCIPSLSSSRSNIANSSDPTNRMFWIL